MKTRARENAFLELRDRSLTSASLLRLARRESDRATHAGYNLNFTFIYPSFIRHGINHAVTVPHEMMINHVI